MQIRVLLFGPQATLADRHHITLALDDQDPTVASVKQALGEALPQLGPTLGQSRLAVNHAYASDHDLLDESDEVALIGMVSGG